MLTIINNKSNCSTLMEPKQNLRLLVKTNKLFNLIVAIETHKTVRELAHRILNCYIQLAEDIEGGSTIPKKRDLEVSSIKFQNFFISKQEIVGSILRDNDTIECILVKAKPKYPKQSRSYANTLKKMNQQNTLKSKTDFEIGAAQFIQSAASLSIAPSLSQMGMKKIEVEREIGGTLKNTDCRDEVMREQKKKQKFKTKMMKKKEKKIQKLKEKEKQKQEEQQEQKQAERCKNQKKEVRGWENPSIIQTAMKKQWDKQ